MTHPALRATSIFLSNSQEEPTFLLMFHNSDNNCTQGVYDTFDNTVWGHKIALLKCKTHRLRTRHSNGYTCQRVTMWQQGKTLLLSPAYSLVSSHIQVYVQQSHAGLWQA